jgi:hypothetical protein
MKTDNNTITKCVILKEKNEATFMPWISYTIDDGFVYIASFQPMGRFSDFSATGK